MKLYRIRYTTEMPLGRGARPETRFTTVEANSHGEAQRQLRESVGLVWFIESRYQEVT